MDFVKMLPRFPPFPPKHPLYCNDKVTYLTPIGLKREKREDEMCWKKPTNNILTSSLPSSAIFGYIQGGLSLRDKFQRPTSDTSRHLDISTPWHLDTSTSRHLDISTSQHLDNSTFPQFGKTGRYLSRTACALKKRQLERRNTVKTFSTILTLVYATTFMSRL